MESIEMLADDSCLYHQSFSVAAAGQLITRPRVARETSILNTIARIQALA
jgi:hypothetical protein